MSRARRLPASPAGVFDAVVIGGGPAGATAARLLSSWGHRVALLTRPAVRPALAESLPPSCRKLFERTGVRGAIDAAGFLRSTGNTVRWGRESQRVERFADGELGYQVSRDAFDHVLMAECAAAGALVRQRATVREVGGDRDDADGRRIVSYDAGTARRRLAAQWVLDCTGRAGLLARRGWRRADPRLRTMAIAAVWERRDGWPLAEPSHTLVENYEGGWAWSVPVSETRRHVTVMVDPALTEVAGGPRLGATYRAELARTVSLSGLVDGAELTGRPFARDASSYSAARAGEPGVLLVGDAASFIDPLSSFGVKKALASAWLAAVVTHSALANPSLVAPALELYDARERAIYQSLRNRLADLSREAADVYPGGFWHDRADPLDTDLAAEPDVSALRSDPDVLIALAELKQRPSIALHPARTLARVRKPVVSGNTIVLEEHLVAPAFPDGIRYLRSVDLTVIVSLAGSHDQLPALFDAYNRAAPPAALPDFLGALCVLVGKGMLAFA
jgi:flavin-dependent dehydrogenase